MNYSDILKEELELKPLWDIFSDLEKNIETRGTTPKYRTGLTQLDEILWGLHKKEVLTIGARTSLGKSALVTHLLFELADSNQTVIDFTNEMTEEQMCERLFTRVCSVNNIALRKGQALDLFNEKKKLFKDWALNANILLTNKYGRKFDSLLEVCKKINPDFIIIDYIQMVQGDGDQRKNIADFLVNAGELAKDMKFGVINVSQINRAGASEDHNTRPYMHQLKFSGALEEFSDTVILLHWDFKTKEYFMYVEKQRHGEVGKIQVNFMPQFNMFEDYTPPPPDFGELKRVERKDLI